MITVRARIAVALAACAASAADAQSIFRDGFDLKPASTIRVLRDDRVATVEMDYDAEHPFGQFWNMSGSPRDDAGFLVSWWPDTPGAAGQKAGAEAGACLAAEHAPAPRAAPALPPGGRWLVTGNRRVQLQPLVNGARYTVRVERLNALGEITSVAATSAFDGGDGARVDALRASLTHFDDFNLPAGSADVTRWTNATVTSTDPRFNLFFVNDQYHAHTLNGTRTDANGDKSQTSQRFRQRLRVEPGVRRRVVFDMDSPLSPRSVWYLDLNPIATETTAHASFFDEEGALGLPAGILRLRAAGQEFSVSLVDAHGASHRLAAANMEEAGRQSVSNVRRAFDVRIGTDGVEVFVDGRSLLATTYAPYAFAAGDYELLWVGFGYNTPKDANPYYLVHWDNFGFDGPVVDANVVHDYVTRIAGTDYQKGTRSANAFPTFTVKIPDDLRPTVPGAVADATLVFTYQMGDYSPLQVAAGDTVQVNGAASLPLPQPANNSVPHDPALLAWGMPHTVRVPLGRIAHGGASPLAVGDNAFRFSVQNAGILNVHVEVSYPPGSAPAYTRPAAIHHFPMHAELPRLGPPARFQRIGDTDIGEPHHLSAQAPARIAVAGVVPLNVEVGNRSWAGWAPQWMNVPVISAEIWSSGGTAGIARLEVFVRPSGGAGLGQTAIALDTARDAPAPQGRYLLQWDTRTLADGDYDLYVRATTPSGLASVPNYGDETHHFDAAALSGAYYPIRVRVDN